jgi:hypothetical protein
MIGRPAREGPNTLLRDAPDAFEIIGFEAKPSAIRACMSYEGNSDLTQITRIQRSKELSSF